MILPQAGAKSGGRAMMPPLSFVQPVFEWAEPALWGLAPIPHAV